MARRREAQPPAGDEDRSGWAHYERVGPHELDYVEPCPDPGGPHGSCGTSLAHGWRSSGAAGTGCVTAG